MKTYQQPKHHSQEHGIPKTQPHKMSHGTNTQIPRIGILLQIIKRWKLCIIFGFFRQDHVGFTKVRTYMRHWQPCCTKSPYVGRGGIFLWDLEEGVENDSAFWIMVRNSLTQWLILMTLMHGGGPFPATIEKQEGGGVQ